MTPEELYLDQLSYVRSCLRNFGARRSEELDLAHEVFVRTIRSLPDVFDDSRSIRPWLMGIAFRVMREVDRRKGPSPGIPARRSDPLRPDEILETRETNSVVRNILNRIHPSRRRILELSHFDELPMPEIAARLGVGLNTAYSALRLARQEFRAALREFDSSRHSRRMASKTQRVRSQ